MTQLRKRLNLLYVLMVMHLKASDYRSLFGILWSFIGPALTFAVLYFIFIDRMGRQIPLFPIKLLTGVVTLYFFMSVVNITNTALSQRRDIVINSTTPTEILIFSALIVPATKFFVELSLCALLAAWHKVLIPAHLPLMAVTAAVFLFMSVGVGLLLEVLSTFASDVQEIWNRITPIFYFATPIFYGLEMLSQWGRQIVFWANPITPFLLSFRFLLLGERPQFEPVPVLILGPVYAVLFFGFGYFWFKKIERVMVQQL